MIFIIKKIVYALCMLYTVNIFISKMGKVIPINIYTIAIISIYDVFGIMMLIFLKYYC